MNEKPIFKTSSYSNISACVEVATNAPSTVYVRDSKDQQGPIVAFLPGAWRAFVGAVKVGVIS